MTAPVAQQVLMRTGLPAQVLFAVWNLCVVGDGAALSFPELCVALFLARLAREGSPLPQTLPPAVADQIRVSITAVQALYVSTAAAASSSNSNIATSTPGPPPLHREWAISQAEKAQSDATFRTWDPSGTGFVSGDRARQIFAQSGLHENILAHIWSLADIHGSGKLNSDEFAVAMHLIYRKLNGHDLPRTLPPELIPPSTRDLSVLAALAKDEAMRQQSVRRISPAASLAGLSSDSFLSHLSSQGKQNAISRPSAANTNAPVDNARRAEILALVESKRKQLAELKESIESDNRKSTDTEINIQELRKSTLRAQQHITTLLRTKASLIPPVASTAGPARATTVISDADIAEFQRIEKEALALVDECKQLQIQFADNKASAARAKHAKEAASSTSGSTGDKESVANKASALLAARMAALGMPSTAIGGTFSLPGSTSSVPHTPTTASNLADKLADIDREKFARLQEINDIHNRIMIYTEQIRSAIQIQKASFGLSSGSNAANGGDRAGDGNSWDPSVAERAKFEEGVGLVTREALALITDLRSIRNSLVLSKDAVASTQPSSFQDRFGASSTTSTLLSVAGSPMPTTLQLPAAPTLLSSPSPATLSASGLSSFVGADSTKTATVIPNASSSSLSASSAMSSSNAAIATSTLLAARTTSTSQHEQTSSPVPSASSIASDALAQADAAIAASRKRTLLRTAEITAKLSALTAGSPSTAMAPLPPSNVALGTSPQSYPMPLTETQRYGTLGNDTTAVTSPPSTTQAIPQQHVAPTSDHPVATAVVTPAAPSFDTSASLGLSFNPAQASVFVSAPTQTPTLPSTNPFSKAALVNNLATDTTALSPHIADLAHAAFGVVRADAHTQDTTGDADTASTFRSVDGGAKAAMEAIRQREQESLRKQKEVDELQSRRKEKGSRTPSPARNTGAVGAGNVAQPSSASSSKVVSSNPFGGASSGPSASLVAGGNPFGGSKHTPEFVSSHAVSANSVPPPPPSSSTLPFPSLEPATLSLPLTSQSSTGPRTTQQESIIAATTQEVNPSSTNTAAESTHASLLTSALSAHRGRVGPIGDSEDEDYNDKSSWDASSNRSVSPTKPGGLSVTLNAPPPPPPPPPPAAADGTVITKGLSRQTSVVGSSNETDAMKKKRTPSDVGATGPNLFALAGGNINSNTGKVSNKIKDLQGALSHVYGGSDVGTSHAHGVTTTQPPMSHQQKVPLQTETRKNQPAISDGWEIVDDATSHPAVSASAPAPKTETDIFASSGALFDMQQTTPASATDIFQTASRPEDTVRRAHVLYEYTGTQDGDIHVQSGEVVTVESEHDEWVQCVTDAGITGWIPRTYIKMIDTALPIDSGATGVMSIGQARVMFDSLAQQPNELTIYAGTVVDVLSKQIPEWWSVRNPNGDVGIVPANYLEEIQGGDGVDSWGGFEQGPHDGGDGAGFGASGSGFNSRPDAGGGGGGNTAKSSSQSGGAISPGIRTSSLEQTDSTSLNHFGFAIIASSSMEFPVNASGQHDQLQTPTSLKSPTLAVPRESIMTSNAPDNIKRQNAIKEILITERNYVDDLHIIIDMFLNRLERENNIRPLFGNIRQILSLHNMILPDLEASCSHNTSESVGEVFLKYLDELDCYKTYCSNLSHASDRLMKLRNEHAWLDQFLKTQQQHPRCKKLDLSSYLLVPMQRITRYSLLFRQVLHYTPITHAEHESTLIALQMCDELLNKVNAATKEKLTSAKVLELTRTVDLMIADEARKLNLSMPTRLCGNRIFMHEGILSKSKSGRRLHAYLFNDMLLLVTPKPSNGFPMSLYRKPLMLSDVLVREAIKIPGKDIGMIDNTCMQIIHEQDIITLRTSSASERRQWMNQIEAMISAQRAAEKRAHRGDQHQQQRQHHGARIGASLLRPISATTIETIGTLEVRLREAHNITSIQRDGRKLDVYAIVQVNEQVVRSRRVPSSAPSWNQSLMFSVLTLDDVIKIALYAYDKYSQDEYIGQAQVQMDILEYYVGRETERMKLDLQDVSRGTVEVQLLYRLAR